MGFVWHPRTVDAGIDGMIELRDSSTGEAYNFHILVQSKASEIGYQQDNLTTFEFYCNDRDIEYWLKGNAPVILICNDLHNNTAYWVNVKQYFKDPIKRKSKKIVFDKFQNIFCKESKSDLLNLLSETNSGEYFTPVPKTEILISNLLPLKAFPEKIFFVKTKYRKKMELWTALNELAEKKGINKNWILTDELIYSFNDLNLSPWKNFINGEVKAFPTSNWSDSNEIVLRNKFVQLLNNTLESVLHHKGIIHKHTPQVNLYYIKPQLDIEGRPRSLKFSYNRFGRRSHQSVCERYARKSDPNIISFYRHLAFEGRFQNFDKEWFFEITPTYYFTHDGFKIHTYYETKLKGKKALDREVAVLSETIFWADVICRNEGGMYGKPILKFAPLWQNSLERGIDDELWLKKEDIDKPDTRITTQLKLILK